MQIRWREIDELNLYIRCRILRIYCGLDLGRKERDSLKVTPRLAELTVKTKGPIRKIRESWPKTEFW